MTHMDRLVQAARDLVTTRDAEQYSYLPEAVDNLREAFRAFDVHQRNLGRVVALKFQCTCGLLFRTIPGLQEHRKTCSDLGQRS